jgi:uncharacterized membrane protein YoaK (UPF0700 family)
VPDRRQHRNKSVVALVLTCGAGAVDIVGYLSAYHTFTAHMTGATVHFGNAVFNGKFSDAAVSATVLVAFVCGSLAGRVLIEVGSRKKLRSIASWTLGIEAVLLAVVASQLPGGFAASAGPRYPKLALALLAGAMGLQTATITRVGALTVHTTFVTGMINKFCQLFSQTLFDTYDVSVANPASAAIARAHRAKTARSALFIFSIWCSYAAGAIGGTWLHSRYQLRALYVPVAILCLAILADRIIPLSVEEEKDQAER